MVAGMADMLSDSDSYLFSGQCRCDMRATLPIRTRNFERADCAFESFRLARRFILSRFSCRTAHRSEGAAREVRVQN